MPGSNATLLTLAILVSSTACGEDPIVSPQRNCDATWGFPFHMGANDGVGSAVLSRPDGSIVLGGSLLLFSQPGGPSTPSTIEEKTFLVTLDGCGEPQNGFTLDSAVFARIVALREDANGNLTVLQQVGTEGVQLVSFDSNGTERYRVPFGLGTSKVDLVLLSDGAPIVLGTASSVEALGGQPLGPSGEEAGFIVRFDVAGSMISAAAFEGTAFNSAALTAEGSLVIAGSASGEVDVGTGPLAAVGQRDLLLVSLDRDGEARWARRFGAIESASAARSVIVGEEGRIFAVGDVDYGALELGPTHLDTAVLGTNLGTFIAVFDDEGGPIEAKLGASVYQMRLAADPDGLPWLFGATPHASGATLLGEDFERGGFVVALDDDLTIGDGWSTAGAIPDALAFGPDGTVYATGGLFYSATIGSVVLDGSSDGISGFLLALRDE